MTKKFELASLLKLANRKNLAVTVIVLKIALSLCMALFVAVVIMRFISDTLDLRTIRNELQNRQIPALSPIAKPIGSAIPDVEILVKRPILGTLDPAAARPSLVPKPASTLALSLVGTFVSSNSAPFAIIEDQKKSDQEVFNINDMVFGEAKLLKILDDRVEIERNGQVEILVLDDLPGKDGGKGSGVSGEGTQFTLEESEVDQTLENIPLLLTQARAVPYFKDGQAVGLRLFAIKAESIFEKIGLKNGDILKTVNGENLSDLTQAMKIFEKLKQERQLELKLERQSEEKSFHYEIR